jgi:REP element-mobilizing transposase RayT
LRRKHCDIRRVRGTRPTELNIVAQNAPDGRKVLPKRKQIHLVDYDYSNTNDVFFVTLCTHDKKPYFQNLQYAQYIAQEIDFRSRVSEEVTVFAWCIMPDHLHILLKLNEGYGKSLANWVAAFKRYNARILSMMHEVKPLWQANFYEHVVRKEESLRAIAEYIANNPVRKNLVKHWQDYPFVKINDAAF